jgi:hypothetical protein
MARYSQAVEPSTVWTWNAIGKAPGAWRLAPDANEAELGFLLNHLMSEELPGGIANADPLTGQAGWYDVRVRIYKADASEAQVSSPQFAPLKAYPGERPRKSWLAYVGGGKRVRG